MGLVVADRVKETTATTGTGTLTLAGAATGFQSFAAVGNTNQCNYCLLSGNGSDWETGIGTYTLSGTTLSRDVVLASSNSGSKISLTGTSTVFLTEPAAALANRLCAPVVKPPAASNWTQRNFGASTTLTDVANGVALYDANSAGLAHNVRGISLASPATPYTIDANLSANALIAQTGNFVEFGLGWTDGTKIETITCAIEATSTTLATSNQTSVYTWSNFTTSAGAIAGTSFNFVSDPSDLWLRIADNGSTVSFGISSDGVIYLTSYSIAKSSGYLGSSGYSNVMVINNGGLLGNPGYANVTVRSWYQH